MTARMQRPAQKARRSSSGGSKSSKESNNRLISAAVNKHQRISKVEKIKPYDILCGRDKNAFNNVGNRRFRVTVNLNLPRYVQATSKNEKSEMILSLVRFLRNDVGARFLQKKGKSYFELDEKQARSKVGHALRDMQHAQEEAARKKSEREDAVSTPPIPDDPVQQKPKSEAKQEPNSNQPDSSNTSEDLETHQYDSNDDDDHSFYNPPPLLNNRVLRTHAARQATMIAEEHQQYHHHHYHHYHQRDDDDENQTAPSFATMFDHIPMPESRAAFFQLEDGEGREEDHVESSLLQNVDSLMNQPTNIMMTNESNRIFAAEDHHGDINQRLVALLDPHPTSLSYPCPPQPTPDGTAALKRSMDDDLVWDHSMADPGFLPRLHGKKRRRTAGDESREK